MNKRELQKFKNILVSQKDALIKRSDATRGSDYTVDPDEIKDEVDHAAVEIDHSITIKMKGREQFLFNKIEHALDKINDGSFGVCEECDEPIEKKRLEARPVTTLCITCKEEQEKAERSFA